MLGKVFKMSGLFKGSGRMLEPDTHFRRVLNVWQDRSGKYRPKGAQTALFTPPSLYSDQAVLRTGFTRRFQGGIFNCFLVQQQFSSAPYVKVYSANQFTYIDKTGANKTPYYNYNDNFSSLNPSYNEWTMGRDCYPSAVVGDKLFFQAGTLPLSKFDGTQVVRAGLPLPYLKTAQLGTVNTARAWLKVIAVRVGFDGSLVQSGVLQFPSNDPTTVLFTTQYSAITSGQELVGKVDVSPRSRDSEKLSSSLLDDMGYIYCSSGPLWATDGSGNMVATATTHNLNVGQWVMWGEADNEIWYGADSYFYAMKVLSISGMQVTFDAVKGKKYLRTNRTWVDAALSRLNEPFITSGNTKVGSSQFLLIFKTPSVAAPAPKSAVYSLARVAPLYGVEDATFTTINVNMTVTVESSLGDRDLFAGQVPYDFAGGYDIGTVKLPFPSLYKNPDIYATAIKGLTNYQGLLISYDDTTIYFNDISTGGSDEMINGISNFNPIGSEYGKIVNVTACEDFVFISRERKNYVLVGDMSTGGFTVRECDGEAVGAFSSQSAIAVRGGVCFLSRQGVYFVSGSGNVEEASQDICRLFGSTREFINDPDKVTFKPYLMTDVVPATSPSVIGWDGNVVKMKYDQDRNLLGVLYARKNQININSAADSYSILTINLSSGAWYEWKTNPVSGVDVQVTDLEFLPRYSSTGKFKGSLVQSGTTMTLEDNTAAKVDDQYLVTTWQTGGEPSLEKQTTQLKFYGQMSACRIFHQENWEDFSSTPTAPKTNVQYTSGPNLFEHKQRLNSSRAQAISIGIEPLDLNFSLEGFELEWNMIQEGVKK